MATPTFTENPKHKPPPPNADSGSLGNTSNLNSPELDPATGKPGRQAIESFTQAHGLSKRLYRRAKDTRIPTAAVIAEKYAGGTPFRSQDLKRTGQGWRNNFSTNFLASMVDRAKPQLVDPLKKAETITRSALPSEVPDAARKTRSFRTRVTKLIRGHHEWNDLLDHIAQENYLYGHNAPGWLDDHWFPTAFRYDETFLPERSGQHAKRLQYVMYRQQMLLQDFVDLLQNKQAALDAGYEWEGCIKAANEAMGLRDSADINALERQDRLREHSGFDSGYDGAIKTVDFFHLLVREYDGSVHLWTTTERNGYGIRHVEQIHDSMEDACILFTLQSGNKKFYGSKGAGRMLANMHIAIERLRCTQLDKIQVAGLPIIRMDKNEIPTFAATVRHPFLIIDKECEVSPEMVEFDFAGYEQADEKLVTIAVSIAGAFIPPNIDDKGSSPTKIEAAQKAERELAIKEGVLGRAWMQFMELISTMQRKIFRPVNIREAVRIFEQKQQKTQGGLRIIASKVFDWMAKALQDRPEMAEAQPQETSPLADAECVDLIVTLLEDGLSVQEIVTMALDPASGTEQKQGDDEDQKAIQYLEARRGNPLYDQKKLEQMEAELAVGKDRAEDILLKDAEDPNNEAAATRTQLLECGLMIAGEQSPVVSFDLHKVHRKVVAQKIQEIEPALLAAPTPEMVTATNLMCEHFLDHLAKDLQTDEPTKEQEAQMIQGVQMKLKIIAQQMQKLHDLAAKAQAKNGANGLPPPMNGAPPGVGPDGNMVGDPNDRAKLDLDYAKHADNMALESERLSQSQRQQEMEQRKLDHQIQVDHIGAITDANKAVADIAVSSAQAGEKDAAKSLAENSSA